MRGARTVGGKQWRSACISLDGLLDYDEGDKEEPTLELSLFAECFQDMLMRDCGARILACLQAERWVPKLLWPLHFSAMETVRSPLPCALAC